MEIRKINEYYSINLNGKMKTVLIERNEMIFDNKNMTLSDSKEWVNYMYKVIKNLFNTDEWSYLGNDENFTPEEKSKTLRINID